jgi:hypothetical protein
MLVKEKLKIRGYKMSLAGKTASGAKTKGLSPQEQIAYVRRQVAAGPLGKYWQALERRAQAGAGSEVSPATTAQPRLTVNARKRFLEHVKKLVLPISAPRIFNTLHS